MLMNLKPGQERHILFPNQSLKYIPKGLNRYILDWIFQFRGTFKIKTSRSAKSEI